MNKNNDLTQCCCEIAKQNADANEYCLQELEQENIRYRRALEEIEEIVNETIN